MRARLILPVLAAPLAALAVAAAAQEPAPQQPPAPPTEAQVKALFESACSSCHDTGFVGEHRKNHSEWEWTVSQMISRGAELNPDEAALVVDYLAKTYPAPDKPAEAKPPAS
jgi:mono/diheme cytochrome c family protein